MNLNSTIIEVAKKPIVGEIIVGFGIFLTLSAIAGTCEYFGIKSEEERKTLFDLFVAFSCLYVFISLMYRIIRLIKTR